jgi:hypothetical protein
LNQQRKLLRQQVQAFQEQLGRQRRNDVILRRNALPPPR